MLRGLPRACRFHFARSAQVAVPIFECGCVLARDAALLKSAFQIKPDYLRDVHRGLEEFNPCDYGVQLTEVFALSSLAVATNFRPGRASESDHAWI